MTSFGGRRHVGTEILVNVYDLAPANDLLYHAGLGLYHTGVVINGTEEYTFASEAGVFRHTPRAVPNAKFREQIDMGTFTGGGHKEVQALVDALGDEKFGPNDYHILRNNCNHFAAALCWKLLQKKVPGYINRMADIGVCCSCLIPKQLLEQAPVTEGNDSSNTGETSSFLVKAPANRANSNNSAITPSAVFSGTGSILGGSTTTNTATATTTTITADSLTDRRERARKAALARLDQNSSNEGDKSQ